VGCGGGKGEVGIAVMVGFIGVLAGLGLRLGLSLTGCDEFWNVEFCVVVCAVCLEGWGGED